MENFKIILDTDIGSDIDDSFCLSYLLSQERCNLLGITTVSGEPDKRAMLADAICKNAGKNIPIHVGIEHPLLIEPNQPYAQQFSEINNWQHDEYKKDNTAIEFLKNTIVENPDEIILLAIGPLTNIAVLFSAYPETAKMLKELVIMGGEFKNYTTSSEWNIKCDPHAAQIVFNAPVRKTTVVGLDVTLKLGMDKNEVIQRCIADILKPVKDFSKVWFEKTDKVTFHDPLASAIIFNRNLCEYESGDIQIEITDSSNLGRTYWTQSHQGRHSIAIEVDREQFFKHYFDVLNKTLSD